MRLLLLQRLMATPGVQKRPRLEDFVNRGDYAFIDTALAMTILRQVDAQEAMSFANAIVADPRYVAIVKALGRNDIWRYWIQRDLAVLEIPLDDENWRWPDTFIGPNRNRMDIAKPKWKTAYLWYRLRMSAVQWSIINGPYGERILANAYPVNSRLRFVRLNEMERTTMGQPRVPPELLDFRVEFKRIAVWSARFVAADHVNQAGIVPYTLNMLDDLFPDVFYGNYFRNRFPTMKNAEEIALILEVLLNPPVDLFTILLPPELCVMLSKPPRLVEETRLLVGRRQCLSCANFDVAFAEENCPDRAFCNVRCQRDFYSRQ